MHFNNIISNEWSILVEGFDKDNVTALESIFSLGNGYMGQRANYEETYTGETLQGHYIGGIYYPDKTRVGWWKNGYPEYFAKVLNAPDWIGMTVSIDGEVLDLNTAEVSDFRQELNMKEGWLKRYFIVTLSKGKKIEVCSKRLMSITHKELGLIRYSVKALNFSGQLHWSSHVDGGIMNSDANYDEFFWQILDVQNDADITYVVSETFKTEFRVCTAIQHKFFKNGEPLNLTFGLIKEPKKITQSYDIELTKGDVVVLYKYAAVTQSMNMSHDALVPKAKAVLNECVTLGFDALLEEQKQAWASIWETADIVIKGDVKAQQAIRFNIFQLNQTYTGEDARLNIGPKGFTGEKYGGSTYWDTEAYCIPFYMSTKEKHVAKNLLKYRYLQLEKAKENAQRLGFKNGAALYPMVTMNGEECHNEWEITFEEIHRNGAIIYAIYNYINYTGDTEYLVDYGLEVMIAVARFWAQRVNYSTIKKQFVILGVTGPNEYENNVNNNWYTNYIAKWCLDFTIEQLDAIKQSKPKALKTVIEKTKLENKEISQWQTISDKMYFPKSEEHDIFLQQDNFLDKDICPALEIPKNESPINQHWSWDRILRSCYIKQADVLQGMYFFENHFDQKTLAKHFDFYEPLTVHESSLSPCVHSILAASLDKDDKAYEMYLRTARLDLDDYNNEVNQGLHITSMAGSWLSVVQGFGGLRNFDNKLSFNPIIPKQWQSYSYSINYRGATLEIYKDQNTFKVTNLSKTPVEIWVDGKKQIV